MNLNEARIEARVATQAKAVNLTKKDEQFNIENISQGGAKYEET